MRAAAAEYGVMLLSTGRIDTREMFTYQTKTRVLQLTGKPPSLPQNARLHLRIEPAFVFGEGDGDFPLMISEKPHNVIYNGNLGRTLIRRVDPLPHQVWIEPGLGGSIRLDGGDFSVDYVANNLQGLVNRLELLRLIVPAALSLFTPLPVVVTVTSAKVAEAEFHLIYKDSNAQIDVLTVPDYRSVIAQGIGVMDTILAPNSQALLASVHYVHAALRLSAIGNTPWEFTAEILLNCVKAIEALFGNSRDVIRNGLHQLEVQQNEIEGVFMPLLLLRNEWDVGHAKIASIPSEHRPTIYAFVETAPKAVRELVQIAIAFTQSSRWKPRSAEKTKADREKGLMKIVQSIQVGLSARAERLRKQPFKRDD